MYLNTSYFSLELNNNKKLIEDLLKIFELFGGNPSNSIYKGELILDYNSFIFKKDFLYYDNADFAFYLGINSLPILNKLSEKFLLDYVEVHQVLGMSLCSFYIENKDKYIKT